MRRVSFSFLLLLGASALACATAPPVDDALIERGARRAPLAPDQVALQWLGTAGFVLRTPHHTLVIDPYLTRASAGRLAFGRLVPATEVIDRAVPPADLVVVGHSHFDHALDAPHIAARDDALLLGTETTCLLARRLAPAARCRNVARRPRYSQKDLRMLFVPSQHVEAPLIGVPIPGTLARAPQSDQAPHAIEMPMGGALITVVRTGGLTLVHISSSALPASPTALPAAVPEGADVVLASSAAYTHFPDYVSRLVNELRPRLVIPHHFESFITPLAPDLDDSARADADAFVAAVQAEGVAAEVPEPFAERVVSPATLPSRLR